LWGQEIELVKAYENYPFIREFYFGNSLGGFDSLISYGKAQRTQTYSALQARKYVAYDADLSQGSYSRHQVESRVAYQVNAGYRTWEEREAAKELLAAAVAFEKVKGKYYPIIIESNQIQDEKEGDHRYTLLFNYRYAFDY